MIKNIGFVPSYVFTSGIGKQIAELKGMSRGWHYPTFLFKYLINPAPLFLFDELIVDKEATENTLDIGKWIMQTRGIESRIFRGEEKITEEKVEVMSQLLDSNIFKKENIEKKIDEADYVQIENGYNEDVNSCEFSNVIQPLKERYGDDYALPSPKIFEAMNINVTMTMLKKFSATSLDDVLRAPLYRYKENYILNDLKLSRNIYNPFRECLYLPNEKIIDVDVFLSFHKDSRVIKFREKIKEISQKDLSQNQISLLINEENARLDELEPSNWNLALSVFGALGVTLSIIRQPILSVFATSTLGLLPSMKPLIDEIKKYRERENYQWLYFLRGFLESQEVARAHGVVHGLDQV